MSVGSSGLIMTTATAILIAMIGTAQCDTPGNRALILNPYASVVWDKVQTLHSFSHEHGRDPEVFWAMGFGHLPISNYYPSRPFYPLPDGFIKKHREALGAPLKPLLETLDFGPRVLGIEVWNQHEGFGGAEMRFYRLWDAALRAGRPCLGFFVKDHVFFGRGRNVLLVAGSSTASRLEREHEALRAYREGRFFGLLGALRTDETGKPVLPYDKSNFRFTRIALKEGKGRHPDAIEVAVDGADRDRRPNTQIRFITDAGMAKVIDGQRGCFELPRDPAGNIVCQYVRVEAFAYPSTHLNGRPLTAEAFTAMNVHEISRLHDRVGPFKMSKLDPSEQAPIPIVDMLFSQPILLRSTHSAR